MKAQDKRVRTVLDEITVEKRIVFVLGRDD
jgi:hypothetical protein